MPTETDQDREILLAHARHPKRTGELHDANGSGHCHNPMCGDKIHVAIIVDDNKIKNIRILPSGCSISIASASLMTELLEGLTIDETESIIKLVNDSFVPENRAELKDEWPVSLTILSPLKRIRENPLKVPCALISWVAVKDAVKNYKAGSAKTN